MPESEIDTLIGSSFVPLSAPAKPLVRRCPFISGPPSRFVTERNLPEAFYTSLALHQEAKRVQREKLSETMVTVRPSPAQRRSFYAKLDRTTTGLRNFIITEVAVFELALATAMQEASDVLEQLTGSQVENLKLGRITKATEELVEMHVVSRLARTLGVTPDVRKTILNGMTEHGKKDMPNMRGLLEMLKAGKGPHQQVRPVDSPPAHEPQRRGAVGARRLRSRDSAE